MKAYTDIEQSKKLAEVLPMESADMYYDRYGTPSFIDEYVTHESIKSNKYHDIISCWSLAALLGVLPAECECMALEHINYGNNHKEYFMHYIGGENTENYDNPVDACVAMIEKLNELKML